MIHKTTRVHLVEQVAIQMEDLIVSGIWPVDEKIPPEMELMKEFDVPREPMVLGLVLGSMAEGELARAFSLVHGSVPMLIKNMFTSDFICESCFSTNSCKF